MTVHLLRFDGGLAITNRFQHVSVQQFLVLENLGSFELPGMLPAMIKSKVLARRLVGGRCPAHDVRRVRGAGKILVVVHLC